MKTARSTSVATAALLTAAIGLSGCISMSRSSTMQAAGADWASGGRVEQVRLTNSVAADVGDDFKSIFETEVKQQLDRCATGSRPLRLDATISSYSRTNPVITTLLVGRNRIRGEATLTDATSGQVVGRYNIGKTIVGGRIAIVKMGPARKQLSQAFGDEICRQAFGKGAPKP